MPPIPHSKEETRNDGRNEDGTYKKGFCGNPSGRPKNTLKAFLQRKIANMSDEQMEAFLKNINPDLQWQMAEGRPAQSLGQDPDLDPFNPVLVQFVNETKDNPNT